MYNLCQKSWNTCIISAAHIIVPSLPFKIMLLYTVLTGTEEVIMFADTSLTNKYLIQYCFMGGRGFHSFDMNKKIILIRNYALINWCSEDFWQRLYLFS